MSAIDIFYSFVFKLDRVQILNCIISKGGIVGQVAKMCSNDEQKAHQFILECSQQCHNELASTFWGEELIKYIIEYSKKNLTQNLTLNKH